MGVRHDRETERWYCSCGSCNRMLGPYDSEESLRKNMINWTYSFVQDLGDTRCPDCVQRAFDDQQELSAK